MCLVTYLPTSTGYILSSNRDEHPDRAMTEIIKEELHGHQVTYPRDIAGGSWIFSSEDNRNVVLLNGAFQLHKRELPYRMSRGLMVKSFYNYPSARIFIDSFDFEGLEPFTLIMVDDDDFIELRWDGHIKHIKDLDNTNAQVWSSCTLYNDDLQLQRAELFRTLIDQKAYSLDLAKSIHNSRGYLPEAYDFNMSRDVGVKTISSTYIINSRGKSELIYDDKH